MQFEKRDAITKNLNAYAEDSIEKKLAFLERSACMETFINQAHKFYLLTTRLAKRIKSEKLKKEIDDGAFILKDKVREYRNAQEHFDQRIEDNHPYISQRGIIINGVISTTYGDITTSVDEVAPMEHIWRVTLKEVDKYVADRKERIDRLHAAFHNRPEA